MIRFAVEAARRGHSVDIFGQEPVEPGIGRELAATGAGWYTVADLLRRPLAGRRRLARDYDVLHVNLFSTRSPLTMLSLMAWPARVLFVDHASRRTSGIGLRARAGGAIDRVLMSRVAGVAAVSKYVTNLDRARMGIDHPRLRTIYNGVDVVRFHPPPVRARAPDTITLITASQLIPEKGVGHMIRAMKGLPSSCRLQIAGDGPSESQLRSLARSLDVHDRVEFLGVRSDLQDLYRHADIYVHPATWQEAFGISIVEAMASGCAVVASDVGAIPELIQPGHTGLIVPPGDVVALRSAIMRLVQEPDVRLRLGDRARERAATAFRIERCIAEHLDFCEQLMDPALVGRGRNAAGAFRAGAGGRGSR